MNYTDILASLNKASAFDLFRISAAIDRVLSQPRWMAAIQSQLRVGMAIEYFDPQANRAFKGQLLEMRRKQAVVQDLATQKRWLISYAAINLAGTDVEIREQPKQGLSRQSLAVGDFVGFIDREQQQRRGQVIRLNDKTVTIQIGHQQWRVAYGLLHWVVESSAGDGSMPELGVIDGESVVLIEADKHD
jgi:hypothetical protein